MKFDPWGFWSLYFRTRMIKSKLGHADTRWKRTLFPVWYNLKGGGVIISCWAIFEFFKLRVCLCIFFIILHLYLYDYYLLKTQHSQHTELFLMSMLFNLSLCLAIIIFGFFIHTHAYITVYLNTNSYLFWQNV